MSAHSQDGEETPRRTAGGLPLPVVATEHDVPADLPARLGRPGEYPYTRGIHEQMYRRRPWTIRQLAGFGTASDTNARYRLLLDQGATGINGVFDYPSLRAVGSDDERAASDVGRGGVAVDVVEDFTDLFADIPLDRVSTSIVSSQPIGAVPHLAMHLVAAERRGYRPSTLLGTSQNDFLMETAVTIAPRVLPPSASFRLECDLVEFAVRELPSWNPVSVTGYNYREAGADAPLEIALCLAHGRAVVDEMRARGVALESVLPRVSFFLSAHSDFFEEVAKFRAVRRMWAQYVREELGVEDERCQKFRFHTQTSGATSVARFPHVNIARSAVQGLAAVLGGTQSLHVNGYDEALSIPTEHAALTALRTQYVLRHEMGLTDSVDPLGGSYLVESLTDAMEETTTKLVAEISGAGGVVACSTSGWVHREFSTRAYEQQRSLDDGRRLVVGINTALDGAETPIEPFDHPADTRSRQLERLARVTRERDHAAAAAALDGLARACESRENVLPAALAVARADGTLGEVGDVFRRSFGTWDPPLW